MDLLGPRKAKVAWNLRVPFESLGDISKDETIYLNTVGAVKDGKILWGYEAGHERLDLADDGRIWISSSGSNAYYSLNRDGEGGLLPREFQPPDEASSLWPAWAGCSRDNLSWSISGLWPIKDPDGRQPARSRGFRLDRAYIHQALLSVQTGLHISARIPWICAL
jgi:hypothetical protein